MADKKNFSDKGEYQYPEDAFEAENNPGGVDPDQNDEDATEVHEDRQSGKLDGIKTWVSQNKRIVIVIFVAVIIGLFFEIRNNEGNNTQVKPVIQHVQTVAPTVKDNRSTQMLRQLQAQSEEKDQQVQKLRQQMNDMQQQLMAEKQANVQLTQQMHRAMSGITGELVALNKHLNKKKAVVKTHGAKGPVIVYHVRAIVPGRAWIVNNYGKELTVGVGDTVPHYGLVQWVDANGGVLHTSSGKLIKYGHNDQ